MKVTAQGKLIDDRPTRKPVDPVFVGWGYVVFVALVLLLLKLAK